MLLLVLQVKESMKLRQIMQTILTLGNALNQGTARGIFLLALILFDCFIIQQELFMPT